MQFCRNELADRF